MFQALLDWGAKLSDITANPSSAQRLVLNVDAALLISYADKIGSELSAKVDSLKQKYEIELYSRVLELIAETL